MTYIESQIAACAKEYEAGCLQDCIAVAHDLHGIPKDATFERMSYEVDGFDHGHLLSIRLNYRLTFRLADGSVEDTKSVGYSHASFARRELTDACREQLRTLGQPEINKFLSRGDEKKKKWTSYRLNRTQ